MLLEPRLNILVVSVKYAWMDSVVNFCSVHSTASLFDSDLAENQPDILDRESKY